MISIAKHAVLLWLLLCATAHVGYGQDWVRRYATRQKTFTESLLNSVTSPQLAVDKNVRTASNLNILLSTLGIGPEQVLDFNPDPTSEKVYNTYIPGNTPITVKFATPEGALALGLTYEIQAIKRLGDKGLLGWRPENVGPVFRGDISLLSLLGGVGDNEVTIIPGADYQGVRLKIFSSVLGAAATGTLYEAYILEDAPRPLNCQERNTPIDVLSGTRSQALAVLTGLGGVANPYNAINGNLTDYAGMNAGLGALNTIYLNTIFQSPSQPGQKLRVVLEDPGGLIDISLLSSFSIQPYLLDQPAGPPLQNDSPLLSLRLLPGTAKYELVYQIEEIFDRVELRLDNTVSALTSLRVYEVSRSPRVMLIDEPNILNENLIGCAKVDLSTAISNYQPDYYDYKYYAVSIGGSALESSVVNSTGTYYIEAVDAATGCASPRVAVNATVNALPEITISAKSTICEGDGRAVIYYSSIQNGANEYSIEWDDNTMGLVDISYTALPEGGEIPISISSSPTTGKYNGLLKVQNKETGCESGGYTFSISVLPLPANPNLKIKETTN